MASETLRVMTYNIFEGGNERRAKLAKVIEQGEADVVAIQEANNEGLFHSLGRDLKMQSVIAYGNVGFHVGLLSRFPIKSWTNHNDPVFRHTLLEAHLETQFGELFCFVAHLHPRYDPEAEHHRVQEVQTVLARMEAYKNSLTFLAGDFNTINPHDVLDLTQWPRFYQDKIQGWGGNLNRDAIGLILDAGYIDCYRAINPNPDDSNFDPSQSYQQGFTLPAKDPNVRLDHIFVSPNLGGKLQSCEIIVSEESRQASDHLPVVAEFAISPASE